MSGQTHPQFSDSDFIRSSRCVYPPGGCLEVAMKDGVVAVRDARNPKSVLLFSSGEWEAFIKGAKAGEFDTR